MARTITLTLATGWITVSSGKASDVFGDVAWSLTVRGVPCTAKAFRVVLLFSFVWSSIALGQTLPTSARIESVPLELTMPERYQVAELLEPIRRVTLIAPADGFVRSIEFRLGSPVRELQEIAQLDRGEASARLKIAAAEVKEKEAELKAAFDASSELVPVSARGCPGAARTGPDRARSLYAACALSGRLVALPVCAGQYVVKGTTIAELADVSALKTLLPVDRRSVASGASLTVHVEGQDVAGKVQAVLPLPAQFVALRELATPFAAAWVVDPQHQGASSSRDCGSAPRPFRSRPSPRFPKRAMKHGDARNADSTHGPGDPQRIRHQRAGARARRHRPGTDAGHRPLSAVGRTDRVVIGLAPGRDAGPFRRGGGPSSIEGVSPDPAVGGTPAGVIRRRRASRARRLPRRAAPPTPDEKPEDTCQLGSGTVLIAPIQTNNRLRSTNRSLKRTARLSAAGARSATSSVRSIVRGNAPKGLSNGQLHLGSGVRCAVPRGHGNDGRDRSGQPGLRRHLRPWPGCSSTSSSPRRSGWRRSGRRPSCFAWASFMRSRARACS